MFRISKKIKFEAAHILPNHEGKCGRLHGHSWEADIILEDTVLQELGSSAGMVCDYSHIKAAVADVWENKLDHHFLNETTGLENPTSENLSRWLYEELKPVLGEQLRAIRIHETCTSSALYMEDENAK